MNLYLFDQKQTKILATFPLKKGEDFRLVLRICKFLHDGGVCDQEKTIVMARRYGYKVKDGKRFIVFYDRADIDASMPMEIL